VELLAGDVQELAPFVDVGLLVGGLDGDAFIDQALLFDTVCFCFLG
jgi:hypothetical protein